MLLCSARYGAMSKSSRDNHSQEVLDMQRQLALLRRHCSLPVVFSLCSEAYGGAFVGADAEYFSILEIAGMRNFDR